MWENVGQRFDMKSKNVVPEAIEHCLTDVNQIHNDLKGENSYTNVVKNMGKNVYIY